MMKRLLLRKFASRQLFKTLSYNLCAGKRSVLNVSSSALLAASTAILACWKRLLASLNGGSRRKRL